MGLGLLMVGLILGLLAGYWLRGKVVVTIKKKEQSTLIPVDKDGRIINKHRR